MFAMGLNPLGATTSTGLYESISAMCQHSMVANVVVTFAYSCASPLVMVECQMTYKCCYGVGWYSNVL